MMECKVFDVPLNFVRFVEDEPLSEGPATGGAEGFVDIDICGSLEYFRH